MVVLVLVFFFIISGLIGMATSETQVIVENDSVLLLKLNAPITELEVDDPVAAWLPSGQQSVGLMQLQQAITHAKNDDHI